MNSLKQMQHRYHLTGADFHTSKTRGLMFPPGLLCVAFFFLYIAR